MPEELQPIDSAASAWLARRDRGFTPAEQDQFLQWLRDDPSHAAAFARLEKTWGALDALAAEWRPAHSTQPNPDLLAAPPRRGRFWFLPLLCAVAAAVALGVILRHPAPRAPGPVPHAAVVRSAPPETALAHAGLVRHEPDRMTLPDGSIVDLNAGAKIEVAFTPEERHVRLVGGEAHFTVTHNPARPFVVAAADVAVRAVGTAFNVRLGDGEVAVLVTEGKVRLDSPATDATRGTPATEAPLLVAGQRAIFTLASPEAKPAIAGVSAAELDRALAWQGVRLEFADMPLADIAAEFNRHNRRQLVIGDPAVAGLRVGGNFRAENVDAFVRLLESSFDVTAEQNADGATILRRR